MSGRKSEPAIITGGDLEMAAEAALEYRGQPLQPFNAHRTFAAAKMGARFLTFGAKEWADFFQKGNYPEATLDAGIVVWLCTQPTATALHALTHPEEALNAAITWADAEGLHQLGSDAAESAGTCFGTIIAGIFKNLAEQELSPEDTELGRGKGAKKKP